MISINYIILFFIVCFADIDIALTDSFVLLYLIPQGAEIDGRDIGENTALHWAAMRGHVEIVKYLLDCGADKYVIVVCVCSNMNCYLGL